MVSGLVARSYEDRLREVGLTTLVDRRVRGDMIEVWKILHGNEDVNPGTFFTMAAQESTRVTRLSSHPLNIAMPMARLDIRRNFFSLR